MLAWHFGQGSKTNAKASFSLAFYRNLEALARKYTVYAIDLPGFGRSSRPRLSGGENEALQYFMTHLNSWFRAVELQEVHLAGHSFGAYLCGHFTYHHPEFIKRLILIDPWFVHAYR